MLYKKKNHIVTAKQDYLKSIFGKNDFFGSKYCVGRYLNTFLQYMEANIV